MLNFLKSLLSSRSRDDAGTQTASADTPAFLRERTRPDLLVTLWPSFPHFRRYANGSEDVGAIRLNPAMLRLPELEHELLELKSSDCTVPLYYDVKSRQLRVEEVYPNPNFLDIRLNHPIELATPAVVMLKAGSDQGRVGRVSDGGYRLTFDANPVYGVRPGESIHIRVPHRVILPRREDVITDLEKQKIEKCVKSGLMSGWFLSYVESQDDVDVLRELVGPDLPMMLKIESQAGLSYAASRFRKSDRESLTAAFGDLYVEVDRPHDVLAAAKLIVQADPTALAGSRMMLSVVQSPVPEFADFAQLSWLYEIGYRRFMLCDEICLDGDLLDCAVGAFTAWRQVYR